METAITVVRESGQLLKEIFGRKREVYFKGEIDLVTDADLRAEDLIVKTIHARYPEHAIVSEEKQSQAGLSPYKWIIDPLDGTTNYAHGFPWFCVSIALAIHDEPVLGAVYHPLLNQLFWVRKGAGAYLNEEPMCVSTPSKLRYSLLATGFPYNIHTEPEPAVSTLQKISYTFQGHKAGRSSRAGSMLCGLRLFRWFLGGQSETLGYSGRGTYGPGSRRSGNGLPEPTPCLCHARDIGQ